MKSSRRSLELVKWLCLPFLLMAYACIVIAAVIAGAFLHAAIQACVPVKLLAEDFHPDEESGDREELGR